MKLTTVLTTFGILLTFSACQNTATYASSPAFEAKSTALKTTASSDKDYRVLTVKGWSIHMHNDYLKDDKKILNSALKNFNIQLGHVITLFPKRVVTELKKVPIWVTPGKRRAEYHWSAEWLKENGLNPDMAHAVQLTDISVMLYTRPSGPWILIHELAHAYHDRILTEKEDAAIQAAYNKALKDGKYGKVHHLKTYSVGQKIGAYAATHYKEYFAEAVEAYVGCNDFYPFVRPELREYDPTILELIEKVFHFKKGSRGPKR